MLPSDPSLERTFHGHRGAVTCLSFNSSMSQLASGGQDNSVMVFNFKQKVRAFRYVGHTDAVQAVAFAPDDSVLVSASKDHTVRIWKPTVQGPCEVMKPHTGPVRDVDISWDSSQLVTCGDDKVLKLFALPSRRFLRSFSGHSNWVRSARFSPDGATLLSGAEDKTVRLWDVDSGVCKHVWYDSSDAVLRAVYSEDGRTVAAAGKDCAVRLWDARAGPGGGGALLQSYAAHSGPVTGLAFHPSGHYLLSTSMDGSVKVWDLREAHLLYTLSGHKAGVRDVAFTADGAYFASAGGDDTVMVWKTNFEAPVPVDREFSARYAAADDAAVSTSMRYGVAHEAGQGSPVRGPRAHALHTPTSSSPPSASTSMHRSAEEALARDGPRSPAKIIRPGTGGGPVNVLPGLEVSFTGARESDGMGAVSSAPAALPPMPRFPVPGGPGWSPAQPPPVQLTGAASGTDAALHYIAGQLERISSSLLALDARMGAAERSISLIASKDTGPRYEPLGLPPGFA